LVVKVFTNPWTAIFTAGDVTADAPPMGSKPEWSTLTLS
jgi:hypothetical protein